MTGLIRATRTELVKTFTVRSWWLLALILLGYVGFTAGILALFFGDLGELMGVGGATLDPTASALIVYSSTTSVGYMFPALIGALAVTTEYRHRTLTPTLLAEPRRGLVLTGKALAATVIGAIFGVIGVIASVGIGASVLSLTGADSRLDDPDVLAALARIVLAMALWAVIGVGSAAWPPIRLLRSSLSSGSHNFWSPSSGSSAGSGSGARMSAGSCRAPQPMLLSARGSTPLCRH